ncbi:hypothetical protein WJX72_001516 [[Myrmecia] bisecta]|uniref:Uncharacterized protein n=1 Tax=[Myrmecia] bisecta TaxID=41462 RepID=A0AAW1R523_9CHLO
MPGVKENQLQEAVAFLQKTGSTGGNSVYEHLTKVVWKILQERPADAVDLLETSYLAKQTNFEAKQPTAPLLTQEQVEKSYSKAAAKLFGNPDVPTDSETGEPVESEAANEYECENVMGDAAMFDAVGAGLGRTEMYGIMLAVKQLGETPALGVATVRFFGKVLGTHADYYVFETTLKEPVEEEEEALGPNDVPMEKGSGSNGYVYFVCNQLGGPLSRLPSVKPTHIKKARQLKKFVTGKLDAPVSAYPPFPGTEAHFLRAQIARIAATTVLCPVGYFNAGEEGALEKAEEFTPQPAAEMGSAASWSHRYPHLKKQGRCALFVKEAEEGAEEKEPTEEESEAGPEALSTLDKDAEVAGGEGWSPVFSSSNQNVKFQVAGVRSNLWPGALAVTSGAAFSNIYVGWGIKNAPFVPMPPPPVATEYDQALVESKDLPVRPEPEAPPAEDAEAADE